jgi:hypothetical protein
VTTTPAAAPSPDQLLDDMRRTAGTVDQIEPELRPYIGQAAAQLAVLTALPSDITDLLDAVVSDDRYLRLPPHDARQLRLALLRLLTAMEGR